MQVVVLKTFIWSIWLAFEGFSTNEKVISGPNTPRIRQFDFFVHLAPPSLKMMRAKGEQSIANRYRDEEAILIDGEGVEPWTQSIRRGRCIHSTTWAAPATFERAWKTVPKNNVVSYAPFCLIFDWCVGMICYTMAVCVLHRCVHIPKTHFYGVEK